MPRGGVGRRSACAKHSLPDPRTELRQRAGRAVLDGPGETDPAARRAAFNRANVPAGLEPLVAKIHEHAWRVTDADVAAAQSRHGDDRLFEVIVSAALGASEERLAAGLRALDDA